jgi:hypothetical protein
MSDKHICIGGPWAGKMAANNAPFFSVPIVPKKVTFDASKANEPMQSTSIDSVVYVKQSIRTIRGYMFFWAPQALGVPECIALLMLAYKRSPITEEEAGLE